ncbi:hypothetical protein BN946_scf184851.g70 [Trametes cinnabarina]|uniref:Uncharacterized protein n=1 Tax=Pycnoporus cinnabarinus TaxID=5643 RepID=A0A060S5G2_PYCCI|nr:hypothetical protein BN946_scf184851.g70 [Trametes cinnabarina]
MSTTISIQDENTAAIGNGMSMERLAALIKDSGKKEDGEALQNRLNVTLDKVVQVVRYSVSDLANDVKEVKSIFSTTGLDNLDKADWKLVTSTTTPWKSPNNGASYKMWVPAFLSHESGFDPSGTDLQSPQRFYTLVDKSYDNAVYTKAILDDIAPDDYQALREGIRQSANNCKQRYEEVHGFRHDLTKFVQDVGAFTAVIEKAGCSHEAEMKAAQDRETVLHNQLNHITAEMELFVQAQGTQAEVREYLRTVLEKAEKEESKLELEIAEVNADMSKLFEDPQLPAKYWRSSNAMSKMAGSVAGKLDATTHIWQYILSDIVSLDTDLEVATESDAPLPQRFVRKIRATRELYMGIANVLDMYAKGAHSTEDPIY